MSTRLRRMLASRGVDTTLSEDIVQEVAVRALDKRVPFTDPDDLYRWAATTARRLHIDHLRSDCRTTCDDALISVADGTDVAHAAERRVALGQVFRALAVMRPREREAILESLEDRTAHSSQALVRRHRARASLRKAVGGVLTLVAAARVRTRAVSPALRSASAAAAIAPMLAVGTGVFLADPAVPAPDVPRAVAPVRPAARPVSSVTTPASKATARAARPADTRAAVPRPGGGSDEDAETPDVSQIGPVRQEYWENPSRKKSVCLEESDGTEIWCTPDVRQPSLGPDPRPKL